MGVPRAEFPDVLPYAVVQVVVFGVESVDGVANVELGDGFCCQLALLLRF